MSSEIEQAEKSLKSHARSAYTWIVLATAVAVGAYEAGYFSAWLIGCGGALILYIRRTTKEALDA